MIPNSMRSKASSLPRGVLTVLLSTCVYILCLNAAASADSQEELLRGFKAAPRPSISTFQSLLVDSTGNFSLSFLRVNHTKLALAVIHVPSSQTLWLANTDRLARWSDHTELSFNGSLVVTDPELGVLWSTQTDGDRAVLTNTSNLQIQKLSDTTTTPNPTVVWQSFDFPADTLVENQNFTSSMSLVSSNGLYTMRLGSDFIGVYAKFDGDSEQMYWKHKALEAKAMVVEGAGPIYARVDPDGYIAMYQNSSVPVDVEPFNSFHKPINSLLLMRLEPDGNLKGYYWTGSTWALNYQAIKPFCELPSPCGPYSLCTALEGCSCLDNRTEFRSGSCASTGSGYLCGGGARTESQKGFKVLRRKGVELPFKELMGYRTALSQEDCEGTCETNCSCWGVVYNNATQSCYALDYPIQTLLGVADEGKIGYFKVESGGKNKKKKGYKIGFGVGVLMWVLMAVVVVGAIGWAGYRVWRVKRGVTGHLMGENGLAPGPYKDLASASFRSIEMSDR